MGVLRSKSWLSVVMATLVLPLAAQDDPAKPDKPEKPDPEVAAQLKDFKGYLRDKKGEQDDEAVQVIDDLLSRYPELHEKDQRDYLKALESSFKAKRTPDQPRLYRASIHAMGTIGGPRASAMLVKAYNGDKFSKREWESLREEMLENIGRCKDEKQVEFLTQRAVRDPENGIKRAAGKALRYFEDSAVKLRKEIFNTLVKNYMEIEGGSKASLDPQDPVMITRKRTLAAIADPWNLTLSKLTGQSYRTAAEWQHWWNKEGKHGDKAWS